MPDIRQRLAHSAGGRETPGRLMLLSLTLHLVVLVGLLVKLPVKPMAAVSEPVPVEFVMEPGPAAAAPTEASPASAMQQAETPPDAATEMPPPPAQPPQAPPVEPAPVPNVPPPPTPASAPDVPPAPPAQQAEVALPTPSQAPLPPSVPPATPPRAPSPALSPAPSPQARPPRPPTRRMAARPAAPLAANSPADATTNTTDGQSAPSRTSPASNGAAWMGKLKQWWDQNSFYPSEASQTNEGGSVRVRIAIAGDGQVIAIAVVQGSGSSVLDAAALAVFRGARLPPLPPGTPPQPAEVVITLHYRPGG